MLRLSRHHLLALIGILCVGVLATTGCGGSKEKLVEVKGRVMIGDKPLTTGFVVLHPDASKGNTSQEQPGSPIEKDGTYSITTREKKGAALGWYNVAVSAGDMSDPNNPYFTKWLAPERYNDPKTSRLSYEVVDTPTAGAYDLKLEPK